MSNSEEREVLVPRYFIKTPENPKYEDTGIETFFTMVGVIAAVIGLVAFTSGGWWLLCLGGPLAFWAGTSWATKSSNNSTKKSDYQEQYKEAEPKPSDEQMDNWHNIDLERIRKDVLTKLDLLPEQVMGNPDDPIMVVGPSAGAYAALGKDSIIRFSNHDIVVVYLTDYHLAAYSCKVDMATGLQTKEATKEYHYKDVVSVETETDNSRVFKVVVDGEDKPLADYQKFALSVANGKKIEVVVSFPQLDNIIKNARLEPTGAENAVKLIRSRLREKKGGIQE